MEKRGKAGIILSCVIIFFGALLAVGSRLWFTACGAQEDGSYMSCHWSEIVVSFLGIVIAVQGVTALLMKERKAQGAAFACTIPAAVLCCFVPGVIISICAMSSMHCRAALRPAAIAIGAAAAIIALAGAVYGLKGSGKDEDE